MKIREKKTLSQISYSSKNLKVSTTSVSENETRSHGSGQIFYLCDPFTRNRANSVTDCNTVCHSKTCKLPQVPCKREADRFLSVQKFVWTRVNGVTLYYTFSLVQIKLRSLFLTNRKAPENQSWHALFPAFRTCYMKQPQDESSNAM